MTLSTGDVLIRIAHDDPQFEELRTTWFGDNPRTHEVFVVAEVSPSPFHYGPQKHNTGLDVRLRPGP